jgi:hypothetical protein
MTKGRLLIRVRGSTWVSVFMVGAGPPDGVNEPWDQPAEGTEKNTDIKNILTNRGKEIRFSGTQGSLPMSKKESS